MPLELGRPLDVPGDARFQLRVLRALIAPLAEPAGPVLRDYPEEAPAVVVVVDTEGMACPVSFARAAAGGETLADRVRRQVADLEPWYDLSRRRGWRTTLTPSRLVDGAPVGS